MLDTLNSLPKGLPFWRIALFVAFFIAPFYSTLLAQVAFVDLVYDGEENHFLNEPVAMDFSPDGQFAYALSYEDNALVAFQRDVNTGDLSVLTYYLDGINGIDGLEGARDIVLSPDGRQVYVAAALEECITVFDRNENTGQLTLARVHRNNSGGLTGLEEVTALLLSEDGQYLYASGAADNAIVLFGRDNNSGDLTYQETFENGVAGIEGLEYPVEILFSKAGDFLYAIAYASNALVIFNRNPDSGQLAYSRTFYDDINGVDGLDGAISACLSPDGEFLYVIGKWDNTVALFGPSVSEGGLSYIGVSSTAINTAGGLKEAVQIAITGDAKYILINNFDNNSVYLFARHPITGDLIYITTFRSGEGGIEGLVHPVAIAESPDQKQVYISGFTDRSISIFTHNLQSQDFSYYKTFTDVAGGVKNMGGLSDVALSSDGKHAYATSMDDNGLVLFQRNATSGVLDFDRAYTNKANVISGLAGAKSLSLSPDGRQVYVAGFYDNAIVTFARNTSDGTLTFQNKIIQNEQVPQLSGPSDLLLSADGRFLYVSAFWEHAILYFSRDANTGTLTYVGSISKEEGPLLSLAQVNSLVLSPDDQYLYATSTSADALLVLKRHSATGELTAIENHKNLQAGVKGLDGACTAVISPNGEYLYAAGANGLGIARFSRDNATGKLTFLEQVENNGTSEALKGICHLAMTATGETLFATSKTEDYLLQFSCNTANGSLQAETLLQDDVDGVKGLGGAAKLGLSADGKFIYVAGSKDDALSVFRTD